MKKHYSITGVYDGDFYTYLVEAISLGEAIDTFNARLWAELDEDGELAPAWVLQVTRSDKPLELVRAE